MDDSHPKNTISPSPEMRFWLVPLTLPPVGIHPLLPCPRGFGRASPSQRQLSEAYHPPKSFIESFLKLSFISRRCSSTYRPAPAPPVPPAATPASGTQGVPRRIQGSGALPACPVPQHPVGASPRLGAQHGSPRPAFPLLLKVRRKAAVPMQGRARGVIACLAFTKSKRESNQNIPLFSASTPAGTWPNPALVAPRAPAMPHAPARREAQGKQKRRLGVLRVFGSFFFFF